MRQSIEQTDDVRKAWVKELHYVKQQLDNNDRLFNMTSDFDVTDYTIHERTALFARYSYLLRCIRDFDSAHRAKPPLAGEITDAVYQ